jgi:integrase
MQVFERQKSIDRAAKLAGVRRITHHDPRRLFATRWFESGVDVPTASRWLGQQDGGALCMKTDRPPAGRAQRY